MRCLAVVVALLAAACGGGDGGREAPSAAGFGFGDSDIAPGMSIDRRYTCDGDDISPSLRWQGAPDETKELALIVEDPDADGFTHWLAYGLPADAAQIPQDVPKVESIASPTALVQGRNAFGGVGYGGPCPPEGETHTYVFRLLALDQELQLPPGLDRDGLDSASQGHVIAEARLEAPYTRGS